MITTIKGKIAELKVITKLMELGFTVSIPVDEGQPYDLIVDTGKKLLKIQVKKAWPSECKSYTISVAMSKTNKKFSKHVNYNKNDFNFLIGVVFETNDFYIIPMDFVQLYKRGFTINPLNELRQRDVPSEKFRNKWKLIVAG